MRQAYDYWQDQPDNYVVVVFPRPSLSPPRTGREQPKTRSNRTSYLFGCKHIAVSVERRLARQCFTTASKPFHIHIALLRFSRCGVRATVIRQELPRTSNIANHGGSYTQQSHRFYSGYLPRHTPESVLVFNTCYQLVIH